jgi:hypothetical protein
VKTLVIIPALDEEESLPGVLAALRRQTPELDAGADLVVGSRFANNDGHYEVGRTRRAAMRVMRRAVKIVSGREFTDPSSGFRAFSRPMLELFAANYSVDYLADTVEALLTAVRSGMRVVEVPVTMRVRAGGAPSTRNVKLVYHYLRLLVVVVTSVTRRHRRPHEEGSSWSPSPT